MLVHDGRGCVKAYGAEWFGTADEPRRGRQKDLGSVSAAQLYARDKSSGGC